MLLLTISDDLDLITRLRAALPVLEIHTYDWATPDPIAWIADKQPNLLLFDLDVLPAWGPYSRSSPATRRIPAIALGNDAEKRARMGNPVTFSKADFVGQLPDVVLTRLKLLPGREVLESGCLGPLPEMARRGLEEFSVGDYYEAHETLEAAWRAEIGPVREVYRAILQIAVAYHQITLGNYAGAMKMFLRVTQWLTPLPDECQGIDIAKLRQDAAAARIHLEVLGPDRIMQFDRAYLKPVVYKD